MVPSQAQFRGTNVNLAKLLSGVVATTAMAVGSAHAAPLFNYDQGQGLSPGGTVVFDGTRLVGANIGFDLMNAAGTSSDGVFHCSTADGSVTLGTTRCRLSFTTGNLVSVTPSGPNTNTYVFGPGGEITLTGYLSTATPGNTAPIIGTTPLVVSGSFDAYTITLQAPPSGVGGTGVGAGLGFDFKDPMMLAYFGLAADTEFRFTTSQLAIGSCSATAAGFTCNVNNADFQNTVPEPGTLALLGLGLLAIGLLRWRAG
jgi:hypothetical protein